MAQLLYLQIAEQLAEQIGRQVYLPGERLPSVRALSERMRISMTTAFNAYGWLEGQGLIEARPKSGYFVRTLPPSLQAPPVSRGHEPAPVSRQQLIAEVLKQAQQPHLVHLGAAVPAPEFLPLRALQRNATRLIRQSPELSTAYEFPPGHGELRRQIAIRMSQAGIRAGAEDVLVTTGCQEALSLCLRAVAQPGDIIAMEAPAYHGLLLAIEALGLQALEIPTDPVTGMQLDALESALQRWPVAACVSTANFSNPSGALLADEKKQALLQLLQRHDVPLIEDDTYGELVHEGPRPKALKAYDPDGRVLYCASFSKTIAPGFRVGWICAGRYQQQAMQLQTTNTMAVPSLSQQVIAQFLDGGGYDRHLRRVARTYRHRLEMARQYIAQYFPAGATASQPRGGFLLWVGLPDAVDALRLHQAALKHGISVMPGQLYSSSDQFQHFIRINCAWSSEEAVEWAFRQLGALCRQLQSNRRCT